MSKARNLSNTIRINSAVTLPSGDTASRPASAVAGSQRYNTDTGSIEFYNGTSWISTNLIPTVNSVTGTIYAGSASNLTLSVTNATDLVTVRFSEGGSLVADVSSVTVTAGSATVAVPAAVYGQTAGDTIAVSILNNDGTPSSNAINKTVQATPTGGTITTSGGFRIHEFTTSSSFVVPSGLTLSNVEYLVIAGGGGGAGHKGIAGQSGGGGGAGGYRCSVVGESSGGGSSAASRLTLSPATYTVTIGAGGAGDVNFAANGQNSVFHTITSTLGGGGAPHDPAGSASSGGSGGGRGSGGGGTSPGYGTGTTGQGYRGGGNNLSADYNAGGGGGAGAQAQDGGSSGGGRGGSGVKSSITGSSIGRAGGGSGGWRSSSSQTSSIGFGGGAGGSSFGVSGSAGTANTGGGGGGGSQAGGGNGGSGIVIVRYTL